MSKLSEIIYGFDITKDKEPVSFSFHCEIGEILNNNESSINTTHIDEKVNAPVNLILFMP